MGMPKLHYPKQPWFSSIAVLTSFVNESPLEMGWICSNPIIFVWVWKHNKIESMLGPCILKKKQRINKHVQGHVLAMHQTYLRSSMSSYTSTCKVVLWLPIINSRYIYQTITSYWNYKPTSVTNWSTKIPSLMVQSWSFMVQNHVESPFVMVKSLFPMVKHVKHHHFLPSGNLT